MFVLSVLVQDVRHVGFDLRLEQRVFRGQPIFEQLRIGRRYFVSDANQLHRQFHPPLSDQRIEEPHTHIRQHAQSLRVEFEMNLLDGTVRHRLVQPPFAARDKPLHDKRTLLSCRSIDAHLHPVVADHRILVQTRLHKSTTCRFHSCPGNSQRGIVL